MHLCCQELKEDFSPCESAVCLECCDACFEKKGFCEAGAIRGPTVEEAGVL